MKKCIKCTIDGDGLIMDLADGKNKFTEANFVKSGILQKVNWAPKELNENNDSPIDFAVDESEFFDEKGEEIDGPYNVYILVDNNEFDNIINKNNPGSLPYRMVYFS